MARYPRPETAPPLSQTILDDILLPFDDMVQYAKASYAMALRRIAELEQELERESALHALDHSLASQWHEKNNVLEAKNESLERQLAWAVGDTERVIDQAGAFIADYETTFDEAALPINEFLSLMAGRLASALAKGVKSA